MNVTQEQFNQAIMDALKAVDQAQPNNYEWTHEKRKEFYLWIEQKIENEVRIG